MLPFPIEGCFCLAPPFYSRQCQDFGPFYVPYMEMIRRAVDCCCCCSRSFFAHNPLAPGCFLPIQSGDSQSISTHTGLVGSGRPHTDFPGDAGRHPRTFQLLCSFSCRFSTSLYHT